MPKYYYIAGGLMLLLGLSAGAYFGWQKTQVIDQTGEQDAILGEVEEKTPSPSQSSDGTSPPPIHLRQGFGGQGEKDVKEEGVYTTPYQTPYQKPNPCIQAKKDLDAEKANAQKIYDGELLEISNLKSELSRQRNTAVNSYLTAIALATSKYNSATSSDAYASYQQEQTTALANYTAVITSISDQETSAQEKKTASREKYDAAIAAAELKYQNAGCN